MCPEKEEERLKDLDLRLLHLREVPLKDLVVKWGAAYPYLGWLLFVDERLSAIRGESRSTLAREVRHQLEDVQLKLVTQLLEPLVELDADRFIAFRNTEMQNETETVCKVAEVFILNGLYWVVQVSSSLSHEVAN